MPRNLPPSSTLATVVSRRAVASEKLNAGVKDVEFLHLIRPGAMVFSWCRGIALAPVAVSRAVTPRKRPLRWTGNRDGKPSGSRYCADAAHLAESCRSVTSERAS